MERLRGLLPRRIDVDPDDPAAGLARLVLTIVELVRQLLERQAIRRMEGGSLTDDETERVGIALMKLEEKVVELAGSFGLRKEDLELAVEARPR
ncbi:MAG TPA: gas vesicle protein K [Candidatus Limnocylindria bacterium]|nr:gas vesicle protein K [Candidatus Limnocylindria bacterium]